MSLVSLKEITVTLATPLFSDLDLTIHPGDRIGLVAANGRGKSTLLQLLAGTREPTAGVLTRARGLRVEHVTQDVPPDLAGIPLAEAVRRALTPEQAEGWRVDIVLDDLEVPDEMRSRAIGSLSGGWQRIAMLARACIAEPDLLLLDEPTNHLDLARIGWLQGWIARLPRDFPLVVASHDRAFLDTVTTRTLFLRAEASRAFPLPYSRARAAMDEADAADERRFRNEMQKAGQLRRQAARLKNIGINSGSDLLTVKTRQLTARAARIEAMARPAHAEHGAGAIRLAGAGAAAKALVTFDDADITAPDGRRLFGTGRKWITRGDRVVLLGANGAGKSRMMATVIAALGGEVAGLRVAPSVVAGNTDQGLAEFDGAGTPLEAVAGRFDIGDQAARSLLAGAGIAIDAQGAAMARLSGGQRARLAMLVLRLTRPNLYLLDEPTNQLDIEGQETLEAELCADEAACLLISHDRAFVQAVGTRFWQIEGRRLQEIEDAEGYFRAALEAGR